jgi:hypothetical protein
LNICEQLQKLHTNLTEIVGVFRMLESFLCEREGNTLSVVSDLKNNDLHGVAANIPNHIGGPFESRLRDLLPIAISLHPLLC